MREWFVAMIGRWYVREFKPGYSTISWNTLDVHEATRYNTSEAARKEAESRIVISGFPLEPLIPHIKILKVRLVLEDVSLDGPSPNSEEERKTNTYPIPQDMGC